MTSAGVDGGWGWVVVVASFTCCFILDGVGYSFGVFLNPLLKDLGGGAGGVAAAGSIQVGVYSFFSLLAARLVHWFGSRRVCMAGALLSGLGFLVASFVGSLGGLVASYSVLAGLGFGMMYVPSIVAVAEWFNKRRALAIGISLCGTGAGTFALAPILGKLVCSVGWRWTYRVLSCLCFACVGCGAVMSSPPGKPSKDTGTKSSRSDTALFKHTQLSTFLVVGLADALATFALFIPYTHLQAVAEERGLDAIQAASLISVAGISNMAARLAAGWMADQPWGNPHVITSLAISFVIVVPWSLAWCSHYWAFLLLTSLFGFLTGTWVCVTSPLLVSLLGMDLLANAFGFVTFIRGFAAISGPPLAGMVVDMTGRKDMALYVSGGAMAASAVVYFISLGWRDRKERREGYAEI